jgi:hypothetical protein
VKRKWTESEREANGRRIWSEKRIWHCLALVYKWSSVFSLRSKAIYTIFSINIYIYIYNVNAFFYWGTTVPVLVPRKQCFVKTPGTSSTNTTRANFNKYNIYIYIISNVRTILEYIHINHTVKLAHAAVRTRYEWFTITLCCKLYVSYSTPSWYLRYHSIFIYSNWS